MRPAQPAPLGGIAVIVMTGIAGLFGMTTLYTMTAIDWMLTALIAVATIGGAIALARYVRAHPGEIGEARFDTSHPDDPA